MLSWHVLHLRSQCEAAVAEMLDGIETFWPHRVTHDNRKREIRRPWFPGYLFVRADWAEPTQRLRILRLQQVLAILATDGKPSIVPDQEIESLRILAASNKLVSQHHPIDVGAKVRVVSGPLTGVEGTVWRFKSSTLLIVQVELLQRAVSCEIEPAMLEAVVQKPLPHVA